jgi:alkanesulfonate monooxygenase SsuD/methylene tetrahydromethanopterin reductase-like flavin-dependent oxidoreductase (luciferase family)
MKIGLTLPQLGPQTTKENVKWLAKMAEEEHFDSLWVNERLLWPLNPKTPSGSPDWSICALGIGWSEDEYIASNIPFKDRGKRADEFVQALTRIWTEDVVEFKGKFYNIPASKIGPKPIQKPRIPICLAGFGPNTFSRITKYADGWMPNTLRSDFFDYLTDGIKTLKEQGKKEEKKLEIITLTFPQIIADSHKEDGVRRTPFRGTLDDVGDDLQSIKEMGVDHVIFGLTEPDLNRVIDTAKQVSKFAK